MITNVDFATWDDDVLQIMLAKEEATAKYHERALEAVHGTITALRAELDHRELETFWVAHPELLRLQVGDKVLVTPLIDRIYAGYSSDIGRMLTIQRFIKQNGSDWVVDFGVRTLVELGYVQQMRRAWLEREKVVREKGKSS